MEKIIEEIEQSNSALKGNYGITNNSNSSSYNNPLLKSQGEVSSILEQTLSIQIDFH